VFVFLFKDHMTHFLNRPPHPMKMHTRCPYRRNQSAEGWKAIRLKLKARTGTS
jgi:hypothetical protein